MTREELKNSIDSLDGEKINELISFMSSKGYPLDEWKDISTAEFTTIKILEMYFNGATEDFSKKSDDEPKINMEDVKELGKLAKGNGKKENTSKKVNENKKNNKKESNAKMENEKIEKIEGQTEMEIKDGVEKQIVNGEEEVAGTVDGSTASSEIPLVVIPNPNEKSQDENGNPKDENEKPKDENDKPKDEKGKGKGKSKSTKTPKLTLPTPNQIKSRYKTVDNLIMLTKENETVLSGVAKKTNDRYNLDLDGEQLAILFEKGNLVYDPEAQRGLKEDKKGIMRANFTTKHVDEIYDAIMKKTFAPTQLQLFVMSDEEYNNKIDFDATTGELKVTGNISIGDGQHRTRAFLKAKNELIYNEAVRGSVDLKDYVFNVNVFYVPLSRAREIYFQINENQKLDKSQARALNNSNDYSQIVHYLNAQDGSGLEDLIATAKPVGTNKVVLFSTIFDTIKDVEPIKSPMHKDELKTYLFDFFRYLSYKLPEAIGKETKTRNEFRKNNLLGENNFFKIWVKLALKDKVNYKRNIDIITENKDQFDKYLMDDKGRYVWEDGNAVKKAQKKDTFTFAMNNTSTAFKSMEDKVMELINKATV